MSSVAEHRTHSRLPLELPLELSWQDDEGGTRTLRTVTRNVSTGGVYFETEGIRLPNGRVLQIDLTLPPGSGVAAVEGRAHAEGVVTRVVLLPAPSNENPERFGYAARFRHPLKLRY